MIARATLARCCGLRLGATARFATTAAPITTAALRYTLLPPKTVSSLPHSSRVGGVGGLSRRGGRCVAFSTHSRDELEAVAKERYGKPYDELTTDEKKSVGGVIGGRVRREQLGHEGYQELGHMGGEARKEQMAHEGYVELGHKGGEARKQQLGHEGYVEMGHKGGSAHQEHAANTPQETNHKRGRPRKHPQEEQ